MDQAPPETREQRHLRLLAELADIGMEHARATAPAHADPETTPAEAALAFARVSRAVRQTIALEAKLVRDAARPTQPARPIRHRLHHDTIAQTVHAAAKSDPTAPPKRDITRYVEECLDSEDVEAALDAGTPLAAIIRGLCQDLGLPFDLAQVPDELLQPLPAWQPPSDMKPSPQSPDPTRPEGKQPWTPPSPGPEARPPPCPPPR